MKDDFVNVYRYDRRDILPYSMEYIRSVLTDSEYDVYLSLSNESRRSEWLCGRTALKLSLMDAMSLPLPFSDIEIVPVVGLKPQISIRSKQIGYDHSLSHSNSNFLVSIARTRFVRVGVDVEGKRPVSMRTAMVFMSGPEIRYVKTVSREERSSYALRCWTVKEAVLKAAGCGIAGSMKSVYVRGFQTSSADVVYPSVHQITCHSVDTGSAYLSSVSFPVDV